MSFYRCGGGGNADTGMASYSFSVSYNVLKTIPLPHPIDKFILVNGTDTVFIYDPDWTSNKMHVLYKAGNSSHRVYDYPFESSTTYIKLTDTELQIKDSDNNTSSNWILYY